MSFAEVRDLATRVLAWRHRKPVCAMCPFYPEGNMITHYLFLNRELLDDVYKDLGIILVVMRDRVDVVNFYNELLHKYNGDTGAFYSPNDLTVSSKASKIIVKYFKDVRDKDALEGALTDEFITKVYAVGNYYDEDFRFLKGLMLGKNQQENT